MNARVSPRRSTVRRARLHHRAMRSWSDLAKRELSKLIFYMLALLGALQGILLQDGIGTSPGIRYGLGLPLLLAVLSTGALWALFASRVRREARPLPQL